MKNIFKKIGFLCTALLALSLGTSVNKVEEVRAADSYVKATSIAVGDTVVLVCESKSMELSGKQSAFQKAGVGSQCSEFARFLE